MKKNIIFGAVLVCLSILTVGCSTKGDGNNFSEDSLSSKENVKSDENSDEEAINAATKVLDAVIKDDTYEFKDVADEPYEDFMQEYIEDFVEENKDNYTPVDDFSIPYDDETIFTPEDILKNFKQTQIFVVLPTIADYTIKDVSYDKDEVEVNFVAHGISLKDMSNSITLIRSNVFEGGLGASWESLQSKNKTTERANELLNYYLYWLAFEDQSVDINLMDNEDEFTLYLNRDDDGNFTFDKDQFEELGKELFIDEYSDEESDTSVSESTSNN